MAEHPTSEPFAHLASVRRRRRAMVVALAVVPAAVVAVCVILATRLASADNGGADLPGFGVTVPPNVMIVFDTSDSMVLAPTDTDFTQYYPNDDYDGPSTTNCRNRICQGKQVLSTVLPSYSSLINFGLAHYFEYDSVHVTTSGGTPADTLCYYDVLAAPGEKENVNIDIDVTGGSNPDEWDCGNLYTCNNITSPRLCKYASKTTNGYLYSPDFSGNPFYSPPVSWTDSHSMTYTPTGGGLNVGGSNFAGPHAGSNHYNPADATYPGVPTTDTPTYTLRTVNTDPATTAGPYYEVLGTGSGTTRTCPSDTTAGTHVVGDVWNHVTSTAPAGYTVNSALAGCSAYNPCTFYFHALRQVVELNQTWCQYQRQRYYYYAPLYTYQWTTVGGEQLTYISVDTTSGVNYCAGLTSNSNAYTGLGPTQSLCPATNTTNASCKSPVGRNCLLYWRTSETLNGITYNHGRTTPAGVNTSASYCVSPDMSPMAPSTPTAGYINQPTPNLYPADWCSGRNAAGTTSTTTVTVMADYYDPTNKAGGGTKGLMQAWSGVPTSYSGNPPPRPHAIPTYPPSSPNPGAAPYYFAPSLVFVDMFGSTNPTTSMTDITKALLRYNANTNPTGLQLPFTCLTGCSQVTPPSDVTPLYGAIAGATFYLQQQLQNDPNSTCRRYYLLMVTDGLENTPANYQQGDLVTAISNLHSLSSSNGNTTNVDTFVIGFGNLAAGAPLLDAMAQAGGTAIDSSGNINLITGHAFSAANQKQLQASLTAALSSVAAGQYTRSKPVLNSAGNRVYIGYFDRSPNIEEWQGNMDAFNISNAGAYTRAWQFGVTTEPPELSTHININGQTARYLYTTVDQTTGVIPFNTKALTTATATQQNTLYTQMGTTQATGDAVISFMYNMSNNAPFVTSGVANGQTKASRLSDIYHSVPILVGPPPHNPQLWGVTTSEKSSYATFQSNYTTNFTPTGLGAPEYTLYAGANDGQVHAIREDPNLSTQNWAGSERWAFVPNPVLSELSNMRNGHQYTVDGNFMADDLCTGQCSRASDWHTVLLTSLRDGGAAITALDVAGATAQTTPPTPPVWMWDFHDGNLGSTYSTPAMGRLNVNLSTGSSANKWVSIIGGGYSIPDAANPPDEIGDFVYVLDNTTGQIISDGTTNAKFLVDMALGPNPPFPYPQLPKNNIASEIAAFRPNDNAFISQAYFGTTQGRIYEMFLTHPAVSSWAPVKIFDPYDSACEKDIFGHSQAPILGAAAGTSAGTLPLAFTSTPPPFFARPIVAFDVQGRPMIFMGTGDSTNPASTTEPTNYFFAIRDNGLTTSCEANVAWAKQLAPNEKVVSAPVVVNGTVIFSTYTPPPSGQQCTAAGSSTLYAFDMVYGTPVNALTQVDSSGNPLPPVVNSHGVAVPQTTNMVTIPNRGILSDLTVSGTNLVAVTEIAPTSQGNGSNTTSGAWTNPLTLPPTPVKVMSWRRVK
jgi:hypothetical protein